MFSIISHCCRQGSAPPSPERRMGTGTADLVLGAALIIIASLSIQGILPGALTTAPAAVLIALGSLNLMIGVLLTGAASSKHKVIKLDLLHSSHATN